LSYERTGLGTEGGQSGGSQSGSSSGSRAGGIASGVTGMATGVVNAYSNAAGASAESAHNRRVASLERAWSIDAWLQGMRYDRADEEMRREQEAARRAALETATQELNVEEQAIRGRMAESRLRETQHDISARIGGRYGRGESSTVWWIVGGGVFIGVTVLGAWLLARRGE